MNKSFLTFLASVLSLTVFGQQQNYYKMPNGKIIDSKTYENVKAKMAAYGKVEERFIAKITRNDSVIITPKLNVLTQKDDQGNYIDPYAAPKKLIGSRFPIELFKGDRSAAYAKDRLKGKPSVINCWFTTCVPCIEEMPNLNALKQEFDNRVNFLAITFDDKAKVNAFLKKNTFTYAMVTDAQKPLADLQIEAFPTNFILDKDGVVIDVYGDISSSEAQVKSILTELLK